LPHTAMFMAMGVVREHFMQLSHTVELPNADVCSAISRITDIDLAAMTGNFLVVHEEERLREFSELIVSSVPVTVLVLDEAGRVTAATRPERSVLGDHIRVGEPCLASLPAAVVEGAALEIHMRRAVETGRQISIPRVDAEIAGETRHLALHIQPMRHGRASLIMHLEDITDAVQNEARMRRSESLAQIGALSAAVAHELRNPLAGISGALQVFARSLPEDDRRQPIMQKVLDQILSLNRLVSDLLAFARPKEPHVQQVDMGRLVRDILESQEAGADRVTFLCDGEAKISADPDMLRQVLLNLVLNAIQAMDGEGTLRVEVLSDRVRVMDSGPGVSAEAAEQLFEPFFTTKVRGTGLGLPISQRMMNAMEGEIALLEERPLGGACFELRFELRQ
ncbi:MAG: PAS domain-containing protein, partial [Balneolales bacterium]|nr:PAS domain-containing protein [Balneolales bacterium]